MRLDSRQFRFVVPFVSLPRRKVVRFGGKRGSIQIQETALVVEGELLRFTFIIGLEWLFRRALSEWTTVTVPYSRIDSVRLSKLWPLRVLTLLFTAIWIALSAWFWDNEAVAPIMVIGFALFVLLLYVNFRVKRAVRVVFQAKDRRRVLAFTVRRRPLRHAFMETLRRHQDAARQYQIPTVTAVPIG